MTRISLTVAAYLVLCTTFSAMAGSRSDVEQQPQRWADAYNSGGPKSVTALYAKDAVLWGTSAASITKGANAIKAYFEASNRKFPGLKAKIQETVVQEFGNVAISSGVYEISNVVDGTIEWVISARFSFAYSRNGGEWKIVHHHSSMMPR
jgi:uncharacterized protein (TIGR02246 family)